MTLAMRDQQHHTYAEYLSWTDDARYELLDGKAYLMSPAPDLLHQDIVGEIFFQAKLALQGKACRAFVAPLDVRLPKQSEADEQIDTVIQPDVFVVCDQNKLDKRGVHGAPDWIVEVLSSSTASYDQIKKRRLYESHGVREFWLVHPIDRMLTIYLLENGEYGKPQLYSLEGEITVSILPEITICWDEVVTRLPKSYDSF